MTARECITERRSIRKFKAEPVNMDVLKEIVETASFAPSWKNTQVARYIAVTDEKVKAEIAENATKLWAGNGTIINGAPVLIVETMLKGRSGYERDGSFTTSKGTHWTSYDAGIAAEALCLAAHEQGIGSVIMGIFDEKVVADILSIPEDREVAALIAIGIPDEAPAAPKRKPIEDLLTIV